MTEFEIGDVVQLKSGGPEMTITDRETNRMTGAKSSTHWETTWFDGREQKWGTFHQDTIEIVDFGD